MITIKVPGKVWEDNVDAIGEAVGEDFPLDRTSREWATSPAPAGRFGHVREATVPEEVALKVAKVLDEAGAKTVAASIAADIRRARDV